MSDLSKYASLDRPNTKTTYRVCGRVFEDDYCGAILFAMQQARIDRGRPKNIEQREGHDDWRVFSRVNQYGRPIPIVKTEPVPEYIRKFRDARARRQLRKDMRLTV